MSFGLCIVTLKVGRRKGDWGGEWRRFDKGSPAGREGGEGEMPGASDDVYAGGKVGNYCFGKWDAFNDAIATIYRVGKQVVADGGITKVGSIGLLPLQLQCLFLWKVGFWLQL